MLMQFAEQANAALTASLASRQRWDEPPALLLMYEQNGTVEVSMRSMVRDDLWAFGRPPDVLAKVADTIARIPRRDLAATFGPAGEAGLCGIAFRHEGWVAAFDPETAPEAFRRQVNADARAHRIHTRPDKIECRMISATTQGGQFFVIQHRGEEPIVMDKVGGSVPDSLLTIWRHIERALRAAKKESGHSDTGD